MSEDVELLKKGYQEIRLPSNVAARIRAQSPKKQRRNNMLPLAVAMVAVAGLVALLPPMLADRPATHSTKSKPSLSMLAELKPDRPAGPVPSLNNIRSVRRPPTPRKPVFAKPEYPQSDSHSEPKHWKEEKHV